MADLREIFAGIGIGPNMPFVKESISGLAQTNEMVSNAIARQSVARQRALEAAAGPGFNQNVSAAYASPGSSSGSAGGGGGDDDDFSLSNFFGDAFKAAIEVVDTPRAFVVSGVKELLDTVYASPVGEFISNAPLVGETPEERAENLARLGTGSWNDFVNQGWDNIGFGDVVQATSPDRPIWVKRAAGLAGDIALDPLRGVATLGRTAGSTAKVVSVGDRALVEAINAGGRTQIAKGLAAKMAEVGLEESAAAKKLVAEVAQRGRGGLTESAIKRAGLNADELAALNLPSLERTLVGFAVPKGKAIAEGVEATKGIVKRALGDNAAAEFYRMARFTDKNAKRAMTNILRRGDDPEKIWQAVKVLGLDNASRNAAGGWARDVSHRLLADMKESVGKISDNSAIEITHALEAGVDNAGANVFKNAYETVANDFVGRGLLDPSRVMPNYVPHMSTSEAAKFSRSGNKLAEEVKTIISKISDNPAFLHERLLVADGKNTFLGEVLQTGSIDEINQISAKHGFKMFEDDIRIITAKYLGAAEREIGRDVIRKGLIDAGIATDKGFTRSLSAEEITTLEGYKNSVKDVRRKIKDLAGKSVSARKRILSEGRDAAELELKQINGNMKELKTAVDKLGRERVNLQTRIASSQRKVDTAQESVDMYQRVLDTIENKQRRAVLVSEQKEVLKKLEAATAELDEATRQYRIFKDRHTAPARPTSKVSLRPNRPINASKLEAQEENLASLTAALNEHRAIENDLMSSIGMYDAELEQLAAKGLPKSRVAPGVAQGRIDSNRLKVEDFASKVAADVSKVADIDVLTMTNKQSSDLLNDTLGRFNEAIAKANVKGTRKIDAYTIDELRTRAGELQIFLESEGLDAAAEAIVRQNASAWLLDANAHMLGMFETSFNDMINVMQSKDFGSVIKYDLSKGFSELTESKQIPEWLGDALKAETIIKDPKFFPEAARYMKQFEQSWKSWALARPGAVLRNALGSTMSMYIEAGPKSIKSLKDFISFNNIWLKNPDNYMDEAVKRFGLENANMMKQALDVVSGSGGGQSLVETGRNLLNAGNFKPWSNEFRLTRKVGKANEMVESVIRGAHAYDVLKRGGSSDLALDVVEKWHFNYKDITNFDRRMKHVIPFWAFMSNNMALQAHVWTHNLKRLNQTYLNLQRNMQLGQEEEPMMPKWMQEANVLPFNVDPEGTSQYVDLGLPTFDFSKNIQAWSGDPTKVLSSLAPWYQTPLSGVAGESFYSGSKLTGYRDAGIYGQVLGRVPGLGGMFPETGSGGYATTPYTLQVINSLFPGASNANRLSGGSTAGVVPAWVSFITGAGLPQVTPFTREAQLRAAERELSAAEYKKKMLEGM